MVISFKDQVLERQLTRRSANQELSASQLARRDLERFAWITTSEQPINLNHEEFLAVASIVKAIKWFQVPSQIVRLPLMVEDCILSTRSASGEYSKVEHFGIEPSALFAKLRAATPLQLLALLDRAEQFPEDEIVERPWVQIKDGTHHCHYCNSKLQMFDSEPVNCASCTRTYVAPTIEGVTHHWHIDTPERLNWVNDEIRKREIHQKLPKQVCRCPKGTVP
jgi:hypothetical protein